MTRPFALAAAAVLALGAGAARADMAALLDQDVLPGYASFAAKAGALNAAASADCTPAALRRAYDAAFDAWMAVGDLRLGPTEAGALTVAFWPDERGFTQKGLRRMVAEKDPAGLDPAQLAQGSAATRGLLALDMLLGDPAFAYGLGDYTCTLVRTVTADLAAQADQLAQDWTGFAAQLRHPGQGAGVAYLDAAEALRAVYTQIIAGLAFTEEKRLGLPLGSFDAPKPKRAEAWRTGRALPDILAAARAAHRHAALLADAPMPQADAALARVEEAAARIGTPDLSEVADPSGRLRVEALAQRIRTLKDAIEDELGDARGITTGFNAGDGD